MGFRGLFRGSRSSSRHEVRMEFLGEHAGPAEMELKDLLGHALARCPTVSRAYLARVGVQPAATPSVAFCLAAQEDTHVLQLIHEQFRTLFAADAFVDILSMSPEQEAEVACVCSPFYTRAPSP